MPTFSSISTTSGSPTSIYDDSTRPVFIIFVHNDSSSTGPAHIFINSETNAEDEITLAPGVAVPVKRVGAGITKVTAYADSGTVNIYSGILER
jgi:hypothetical protein